MPRYYIALIRSRAQRRCPSSNLRLRVCRRLEDHPIRQLLAANVPVTINADDPLLFGCTLAGEYSLCRAQLGLSDSQLAECARASFRHSCAPEAVKSAALAAINDWAQSEGSIERPGAAKAVVIMGVCGTGKTTTAELLAEKLGAVFLEGDDFHSVENKAKMGIESCPPIHICTQTRRRTFTRCHCTVRRSWRTVD